MIDVQCFPLYSILSTLEQTYVDYLSLNAEGDELAILKTIPWSNIVIRVTLISISTKLQLIIFCHHADNIGDGKRTKRPFRDRRLPAATRIQNRQRNYP